MLTPVAVDPFRLLVLVRRRDNTIATHHRRGWRIYYNIRGLPQGVVLGVKLNGRREGVGGGVMTTYAVVGMKPLKNLL